MGIVAFADTDQGRVPLKPTPSGGGRNPYEAYVYARKVEGLRPGLYHYSAVDNSLGLLTDAPLPEVGDLLAGQPWFDNAAAVVLLVAHFERTMWKYPHPTGFRVVLIEAGHIAQNMLLAATANGLASAPTCAVSDSPLQRILGLDPVSQAVVYTVSIGVKGDVPTIADVPHEPNQSIK
jgi:SagB-type dehydrogenase family enzyme